MKFVIPRAAKYEEDLAYYHERGLVKEVLEAMLPVELEVQDEQGRITPEQAVEVFNAVRERTQIAQ